MSLAEQLQRLQIPGQNVKEKSSKTLSILFDTKTAASLSNEAILDIAYSGFKELETIDINFKKFKSIFSSDSLHLQRNSLTSDKHQQLKVKLFTYLVYLTPYLLLKPAQKTLEWLVRRYQIHVFDKDTLIMCILPYHETLIFGRIIQLFGKQPSNDIWDWLLPCQQEGSGFNTNMLLKQCSKSQDLLASVCKMPESAVTHLNDNSKSGLKVIFSFYARTILGVIETNKKLNDLISFLLPFIHIGLKSGIKDYVCASHMIIAAISSKVNLRKEVRKALMTAVIKFMEPDWYQEGIYCILSFMLYQHVKRITPRSMQFFLQLELKKITNVLEDIQEDHSISQFLDSLIPDLVATAITESDLKKNAVSWMKLLIDNVNLGKEQVCLLVKELIEATAKSEENMELDDVFDIIKMLSTRYSVIFDETIATTYKQMINQKDHKSVRKLSSIINGCLSSFKHQIVGDMNVPLLLGLNHPKSVIRMEAVKQLFLILKSDVHDYDEKFIHDMVIARLNDDDFDVVSTTLKCYKSICNLLPIEELIKISISLLKKSQPNFPLTQFVLAVLGKVDQCTGAVIDQFSYALFGYFSNVFVSKKSKKVTEMIGAIKISQSNPILMGMVKGMGYINENLLSKSENISTVAADAFLLLISSVSDEFHQSGSCDLTALNQFCNFTTNLPLNHDLQCVKLLLLINLADKSQFGKVFSNVDLSLFHDKIVAEEDFSDFFNDLKNFKSVNNAKTFLVKEFFKGKSDDKDNSTKLIYMAFTVLLKNAIISFAVNSQDLSEAKWLVQSKRKLFEILSSQSIVPNSTMIDVYRYLLTEFFVKTFPSKECLLTFLLDIYSELLKASDNTENLNIALSALYIIRNVLSTEDILVLARAENPLLMSLICLLSSPLSVVREAAIESIELVYSIIKTEKSCAWNYILNKLMESRTEILMDASIIKRLFQSMYSVKAGRRKSEFANLTSTKSKGSKMEEKKLSSLREISATLEYYTVTLQHSIIDQLEYVESKYIIEDLLPILEVILSKNERVTPMEISLAEKVIKKIKPSSIIEIEAALNLFKQSLNSQPLQKQAMQQITNDYYGKLSMSSQLAILEELTEILISSTSVEVATIVRIILKNIHISTQHFSILLDRFCEDFNENGKAFEIRATDESEEMNLPYFRRTVEILEVVMNADYVDDPNELVSSIFDILRRVHKSSDSSMEYIKQLLLSILSNLMKRKEFTLAADKFKISLVMSCLQLTKDMQTGQECLNVLSSASRLYPTHVLHNIMHIFSFMGETLLRVDNEHSFAIMAKTIDAVIPVLLNPSTAKRPSSETTDELAVYILETFIDSAPHCPEHRRLHILKHLVKSLGISDYLHHAILLLVQNVIQQRNQDVQCEDKDAKTLSPITLDFCIEFFSSYKAEEQLYSLHSLVRHMSTTFQLERRQQSPTKKSMKSKQVAKNVGDKNAKVLYFTLISFITNVFQTEAFSLNCESISSNIEVKRKNLFSDTYVSLVEELFTFAKEIVQHVNSYKECQSSKVWQSLIQKTYDVVGMVYNLLPFGPFISVVKGLLSKDNELIKKKCLELLCTKLGEAEEYSDKQKQNLIALMKDIVNMISKDVDDKDVNPVNTQLMLYATKLLAIKLCPQNNDDFIKILPIIVNQYTNLSSNNLIVISAILCVAELCKQLKSEVIPYLQQLVTPILGKVTMEVTQSNANVLLLSSCITALQNILKAVPLFMSPYLCDILKKLCIVSVVSQSNTDKTLTNKVALLKLDIGQLVPTRVLIPAIADCYDDFVQSNMDLLPALVEVYCTSFQYISKEDANINFNNIIGSTFQKMLCVRSVIPSTKLELAKVIEDVVIRAFCDLSLKLSENSLRPMYLQIFSSSTAQKSSTISPLAVTFYRLSMELSKRLKSLFLLFFGYILRNCTELLAEMNNFTLSKEIDVYYQELNESILDTLSNCFRYDTQGFVTKQRFESIMKPLVDQLEVHLYDKPTGYLEFVHKHLSPCLVNFAAAVNDSSCWKPLNHSILLKSKSPRSEVRLAALEVICEIYNRMGESYMILVPETIPFLAESLEDDAIEVELQCQKAIKQIEEITGESLQKYF